jgi:hypothetical protein
MHKITCRALLVLALLVPISRLSFGDSFAVSGILIDSGDIESGSLSFASSGIAGGSGATWGLYNNLWTFGSIEEADFGVDIFGGNWSFDGFTGLQSYGTFDIVTDPFTVGDGQIPCTWTGQIDLSDGFGTTLFEIQMAGVGTASFSGTPGPESDEFLVVNGTADVTGTGQIVYEDPNLLPEPSTLTLMMTAVIVSLLVLRFRRLRQSKIKSASQMP